MTIRDMIDAGIKFPRGNVDVRIWDEDVVDYSVRRVVSASSEFYELGDSLLDREIKYMYPSTNYNEFGDEVPVIVIELEEDAGVNTYIITYHMRPDKEDIVIEHKANTEEEAVMFAKSYRQDGFSIKVKEGGNE